MANEAWLDAAETEPGGDERALGPLIKTLEDRNPDLRRSAALALGQIRDTRVIAPLIHALRDPDLEVRQWALLGLGRFGDQAPTVAIVNTLREAGPLEREAAQEALAAIGPSAVPALAQLLKQSNVLAALAAAETLGRIGSAEAVRRLILTLREPFPPLQKAAARALADCTARCPSLEVRAALPLLHRLARQDKGTLYRRIIREIEAATASLAGLPIPAETPAPSVAELPIPVEPTPSPDPSRRFAPPSPAGRGKEGAAREEGAASNAPTPLRPPVSGGPPLAAGWVSSFLRRLLRERPSR